MQSRKVPLFIMAIVLFLVLVSAAHENSIQTATGPKALPIVSNPREPALKPGERTKVRFVEELTIGVEEGDENYMFGNSISATLDDQGCVYVLDWSQRRIQKFDPAGKFLFSMGRKGQGPGEFGNCWDMRFDSKGRIYITDIANKRLSFFDKKTGKFSEAVPLKIDTQAVVQLSNGTYFTAESKQEFVADGLIGDNIYGIFDRDFKLMAEFKREHIDLTGIPRDGDYAKMIAGLLSRSAYKPAIVTAVTDEERIVVGFPDRFEFVLYDISGKPLFLVRREAESRPVTDRHKTYFFDTAVLDFLATGSGTRADREVVRKAMTYPKFLPAYSRIIPMENGMLFVVTDALADSSTVDLFDRKGSYIGHFTTDIPAGTLMFRNGKAVGIARVGNYQFVKRYVYSVQKY